MTKTIPQLPPSAGGVGTDEVEISKAGVSEKLTLDQIKTFIGGGQTFARVVKKVDEIVNNSVTLQDDDELFVALSANKTYYFLMFIIYESGLTPDFKSAFTVPTGAVMGRMGGGAWNVEGSIATQPASTTHFVIGGGAQERMMPETGKVVMGGTAGNLQFQWAQNNVDVSDTKVFKGSVLIVWEETA